MLVSVTSAAVYKNPQQMHQIIRDKHHSIKTVLPDLRVYDYGSILLINN